MTKTANRPSVQAVVRLCGTCWHWEFHARKVKPMRSWCGGQKRRYRSRIQRACEHWIDKPEWMKPNAEAHASATKEPIA